MADDKDAAQKAKELLVYGPVGLALYLRDTAPSFLRLFVARGRAELDQRGRSVSDKLGQAKSVGEMASTYGPSQAKTFVADGLAKVKARAEETLEALGVLGANDEVDEQREDAPDIPAPVDPTEVEAPAPEGLAEVPGPTGVAPNGESAPASEPTAEDSLAIPEYDELSASQVVDRLDGLGGEELEAIRAYELTHRARNTVLGKIDQLTRG